MTCAPPSAASGQVDEPVSLHRSRGALSALIRGSISTQVAASHVGDVGVRFVDVSL